MKKKVLAVLLCLMLVLGILPLSVLAMEPVNGVYRYLKITEVMDQGSTRHNVLLSSDGGSTYYTNLSTKGSFDREGDYYTASIGNVGGLVRVSGVGYKIRLPNGSYIKRTGSIATEGITTTTDVNSATAFDFVSNGSKYAAYEESLTGEYHLVVKNGKLAIEFISDMSPDRDPRYLFTLFTGDLSSNVGLDYISVNIPFEGTDGSGRLNESILLLNATGNSSYGTGKYSQAVPYMNFDVPSHLSTAPGTKVKLTVRTSDPNATYVIRPSDGWHDPVQFIDDRIGYYGDWDYWHGDGKFVGNCLKLEIFVTAPNGNTGSYFVYVAPATVSNSDKRYVVFYSNYPSGSGMSDVYGYREYTRGTTSIDIPTNIHQINVNMPTPAGREFVCWNTKKDGSGTKYTVGEYSSIDFEHNLVLYAIWCGGDLHQWSEPDYTWHYDYSGCLGETVCTRCGEEFWKDVSATVTQTTQECETPEQTVYTVDFGGTAPFTTQVYNDVHKPALGHDYQLLGFEWASGFLKAKVKLVCNRDASHTHEETVNTVKTNEVAATCQSQARITYTATYGEHSESQTQYLPALGHDFQFDSFVWGEDGTAKAYYVCANDDRHQSIGTATVTVEETPPTSCFDGVRTYTATHQGNTGTKTEPIPGIGHDYEFKGFNWYLDLSKAKVMLVCKRDATHTHTVDVPSTMTVTTPATCLLDGVATYTVTYEGHTDSMTKRIPGGHRYQFDSFIWSGFSAMARVVCANDPTHVMNIPLTVTNELTTPATDHTDGLRTYTATYQEYSDTKTQLIPATGHSFGEDWEHDDTHHWHECEGCDAVSTHGEHVYDGEDDPDCNTCDYTRTITPPEHEHDWSADWEKNDTHHWHECQGEGICDITADSQKDGYGAHRYADDADTTCEDCGYVRTIVPTEPVTYTIIQGAEQEVVQGEEAIFVSDADLNLFEKVLVDGQALEEEDYTVESGSTKVTLTGACTAALSLGEHTLVIVSSDGKAETTFTVKAASQPTPTPSATVKPSATEEPGATATPSSTVIPEGTEQPTHTGEPGATATPTPSSTVIPEGTEQPPPTEEPLPTPTRRPGDIPKTGDSSLPLLMLLLSAFCLGFALVSRRRKQAE